jgi:hypothetical protein
MARPFSELREQRSPERQQHVGECVQRELLRMNLQELRRNVSTLTQQEVTDLQRGHDLRDREA